MLSAHLLARFANQTSLAAASATETPTREEAAEAIERIASSKANPGAHQMPPMPAHVAGRVPPCKVQVAFRQKDDGPIDLSKEVFQDNKESDDGLPTTTAVPDEETDSTITVGSWGKLRKTDISFQFVFLNRQTIHRSSRHSDPRCHALFVTAHHGCRRKGGCPTVSTGLHDLSFESSVNPRPSLAPTRMRIHIGACDANAIAFNGSSNISASSSNNKNNDSTSNSSSSSSISIS
ncbi:hypothetical protein ACSSS7_007719 [Eimeria intestinalis]